MPDALSLREAREREYDALALEQHNYHVTTVARIARARLDTDLALVAAVLRHVYRFRGITKEGLDIIAEASADPSSVLDAIEEDG